MAIQTQVKFKDFMKAIEKCATQRFGKYDIIPKSGSARRIELFKEKTDKEPCEMWVVHEEKYVYSDDFKKAYTKLGISKEEFLDIIDSL